jgi:hypothetical protein
MRKIGKASVRERMDIGRGISELHEASALRVSANAQLFPRQKFATHLSLANAE